MVCRLSCCVGLGWLLAVLALAWIEFFTVCGAAPPSVVKQSAEGSQNHVQALAREKEVMEGPRTGESPAAEPAVPPTPEWVDVEPKLVGTAYRCVVVSGPYSTSEECQRELDGKITVVTCRYLDRLLGTQFLPWNSPRNSPAEFVRAGSALRPLGLDAAFIREKICRDQHVEYLRSSVEEVAGSMGRMRRVHLLMEFDASVRDDLRRRWREFQIGERLKIVCLGVATLLCGLSVVFAFLKLSAAPPGDSLWRLRLAVALVILGIIAVVAFRI